MMGIRVSLHHKTDYLFDRPTQLFPHEIRLKPAAHARTPIESYSLKVLPAKHFLNWQQDGYGNWIARLVFPEPATQLSIEVALNADLTVINPFDFFVEEEASHFPFAYSEAIEAELAPFLLVEAHGPRYRWLLEEVKRSLPKDGQRTIDFLVATNQRIQSLVEYSIRLEPGVQSPEDTLSLGRGSCRDSAWLLVQLMRSLGLAARFVSGYLIQLTADIKPLDGPVGPERDFTDLHAWAEVYVPGAGWIGLDATSGLLTAEGHIPLAATAHHQSAAPVMGATSACEVDFSFEMNIDRVVEDPRVTKPYTEEVWRAIDALGQYVDQRLQVHDVRLTHGGEPTFVSIDDIEGAEWNTSALGPTKAHIAEELLYKLKHRFGRGAALQFNLGKWYPGEPLPRWSYECYWRPDGEPVWLDERLLASPDRPHPAQSSDPKTFILALAEALRLPTHRIQEAWEDPLPALKDESMLPVDLDLTKIDFSDSSERQRLVRLFEGQGLQTIAGFVLPLEACPRLAPEDMTTWQTGPWPNRRPRLYLLPGDSPIGLRLPLNALPIKRGPQSEIGFFPEDPFSRQHPERATTGAKTGAQSLADDRAPDAPLGQRRHRIEFNPGLDRDEAYLVSTALCVERRDNMLHVFLPPLTCLEDWLRLVQTIETTAHALQCPVRLEGYPPVHDPRLKRLMVTPDPGVIEVNVHPAEDWSELKAIIQGVYEDARHTRLSTEKFMLDGRHTGTGGGNHVTLGGKTPQDSPWVRRPDLLRSLLTYWQHHPGLSYAFSGQFVGPTSQSPRIDEARDDNLHELDIAFKEMARLTRQESRCAPWMTDRLLRHLLTDLTGNTHRAEFSIDKLFSPDSVTGRLGLLEFRAFEMPPHPEMSLAQMALLRALVAWFWITPYRGPLVRWNTELHDRFMLPHFIAQDLKDVVRDLKEAGFPVDFDWFLPFIEFRFPRYGTASYQGMTLELRQAIEPWHVLGEEMSGQGTARYVDSAVERLEVKLTGMVSERYTVHCNGMPVPLIPTGTRGEFVGGVRFKAWNPPSSLHPTIAAHNPLVFDLVDSWNRRAIGGCTYYVAHPGGRSFDTFPVNANEAESRRFARFSAHGHTGGRVEPLRPSRDLDFPATLDLRKHQ